MYYNGQIVHDIVKKRPVRVGRGRTNQFAWENVPNHSCPYLIKDTEIIFTGSGLHINDVRKMLKFKVIEPEYRTIKQEEKGRKKAWRQMKKAIHAAYKRIQKEALH